MQKQGTVIRWDATRAFGFIRSPDTSADVFFHVRDYRGSAAPREGLAVVYEEIHGGGKGPRAMAVQPMAQQGHAPQPRPSAKSPPQRARHEPAQRVTKPQTQRRRRPAANSGPPTHAGPALVLMLGWLALLAWGLWAGRLPWWVMSAAVAINLLTFLVYAIDKSAAQNGQWRTKESHLHLLSLAGGWPGAWFAQQWLRHKSRKLEFRAVYWTTVVLHCGALGAWVGGWLR
ncbi:cold shock and DUF1294 domain-containing protein [Acidovorax sp. D2M1]|uniref:Cold shock and DUF1294 domain-containing protein n=1 Tax=Acidovorax benzenivorans TaxID=2987520 RepID=A0ABT5RUS3_9BURK|nr:cold shock and DUF1294 domain-containing protein [Acidovorax benzenivorans]MDD2177448.1 cold shock and DUF1294 domain-containing protein [Acidovorax benzenivorans]